MLLNLTHLTRKIVGMWREGLCASSVAKLDNCTLRKDLKVPQYHINKIPIRGRKQQWLVEKASFRSTYI